jgi:hypothetical protein
MPLQASWTRSFNSSNELVSMCSGTAPSSASWIGEGAALEGRLLPVLMVVQTQPQNEETTMLNTSEKVIKHKTGLLNLAEELGNVSKACQVMGMSRDTF